MPTTHVLASAYWLAQAGGIKEAATNKCACLSLLACASGGIKEAATNKCACLSLLACARGGIKEAATNTYARLSLLACASGGCKTSCHQQMCLPQPTGLRKQGLYKKLPPTNVPASAYWLAQAGGIKEAATNKCACLSLLACASGGYKRSCHQQMYLPQPTGLRKRGV